jgi:C4-dicarboxylate transporter DctQ subunit
VLPLIMSYEVLVRYFFNAPTSWAVDFSEYILFYSTLLAAAWLLRHGEHIQLTIVMEKVGQRGRWFMKLFQSLAGVFACGFVVWTGIGATHDTFVRKVLIVRPVEVPKYLMMWVIPFCFFLLFIYFFKQFFTTLTSFGLKPAEAEKKAEEGGEGVGGVG